MSDEASEERESEITASPTTSQLQHQESASQSRQRQHPTMAKESRQKQEQRENASYYTRLSRKLVPSLNSFEIAVYTAAWAVGCIYSIYNVYLSSRRYYRRLHQSDLELGWFGQSLWRKDVSDLEWMVFSELILNSLGFLAVHFVGSTYLRRNNKEFLPSFFFLLSAIFMVKTVGAVGFAYLLLQPLAFFIIALTTKNSKLVYITSILFMLGKEKGPIKTLHHYLLPVEQDGLEYNHHASYVASVAFAWINSRCLSYCLDLIWGEVPAGRSRLEDLVNLLSYCFYLPLVVMGPLVNYKEYHAGLKSDYVPLSSTRLTHLSLTLLRYLSWLVLAHLSLHLLYFSALQYDLSILQDLDLWSCIGVAYAMGQFFNVKYVVYYGVPRAFLLADGVDPPAPTKCVARIALYSDMWKYFDNGLYRFIHKYYFVPCVNFFGSNSALIRLLSSFITFCYIFLWHGLLDNVFVWSVCNFVGVTLENTAKWIGSWPSYQNLEKSYLSPRWKRRMYGVLGSPLCMMSILSQFYFLMGKEAGDIVAYRACTSWIGTPVALFFMFCCSQFSFEMRNWDVRNQLLSSRKNN